MLRGELLRRALMVGGALLAVASAFGSGGCRGGSQAACPAILPTCPPAAPTNGAPCTGSSPVGGCEYGGDPDYTCGTTATCDSQSGWFVQTLSDGLQCPTVLSSSCPASFAEAEAMSAQLACASLPTNLTCLYPEGRCSCSEGLTVLSCTPPAPAGCPATRPRAGTPCSTDAGSCTAWGTGICDGQSMICRCGLWQPVLCYD